MDRLLLGIGVIIITLGVKMIYDARPIVKMYFSFGEENDATKGLKIIGFLMSIVGGLLIYFNI